jgi:hypothetical protein
MLAWHQGVAASRLSACMFHPSTDMPKPLTMKAMQASRASVAKPMLGSEMIAMPAH